MDKRERVLKTINFEEPDTVPIAETTVDVNLMEKILDVRTVAYRVGQGTIIADRGMEDLLYDLVYKCYVKLSFDIILSHPSLPENYELRKLPDGRFIDEIGRIFGYDKMAKTYTYAGTILDTMENVKNFLETQFPDPYAPGRDYGLSRLSKLNEGGMAIGAVIRDPFAHVWEALTPVQFVSWMHTHPTLIAEFIKEMTGFNIGLIKIFGEYGIDLIVLGGDLCDVKGPMLPPKQFEKLNVFEAMREQVETAHRYGIKLIKHTDGNITPILDNLVNVAKIDGLHSLDPSAGVDIGEVKEKYGNRLILYGNVSVDNLATKSKKEIIEETKRVIKVASPSGGHILSSSNSWYGGVKLENCFAMVETGRKYGRYPINVP